MRKKSVAKSKRLKKHARSSKIPFYGIVLGILVSGIAAAAVYSVVAKDAGFVLGVKATPQNKSIIPKGAIPSADTVVDCSNQDGKLIRTSSQNCSNLNKQRRHPEVSLMNVKAGKQVLR